MRNSYRNKFICVDMKKYKVIFKVEKFYEVDLDTTHDPNTDEGEDNIMEYIEDDFLSGNINLKPKETDCQFKLGEIVEID